MPIAPDGKYHLMSLNPLPTDTVKQDAVKRSVPQSVLHTMQAYRWIHLTPARRSAWRKIHRYIRCHCCKKVTDGVANKISRRVRIKLLEAAAINSDMFFQFHSSIPPSALSLPMPLKSSRYQQLCISNSSAYFPPACTNSECVPSSAIIPFSR